MKWIEGSYEESEFEEEPTLIWEGDVLRDAEAEGLRFLLEIINAPLEEEENSGGEGVRQIRELN